jgi:hypothetical protein
MHDLLLGLLACARCLALILCVVPDCTRAHLLSSAPSCAARAADRLQWGLTNLALTMQTLAYALVGHQNVFFVPCNDLSLQQVTTIFS